MNVRHETPGSPMRDDNARPAPSPLLLATLMIGGLLLAAALLSITAFRFAQTAVDLYGQGGWVTLLGVGAGGLAVICVIVGVRWCALLVLSFFSYRGTVHRPPTPDRWPLVSIF